MHKLSKQKKVIKAIDLNYYLHLPAEYDKKKQWPLILFLHGISRRGKEIKKMDTHGLVKKLEIEEDIPFIVVSPQCPDGAFWEFFLEDLIELVDEISNKYAVDKKRLYLTGLSMGGIGTWSLAIKYPNKFAAIAPICGKRDKYDDLIKIKDLPIWAFHGAKDETIPVEKSEELIEELRKIGGNVKFTVYPEADHDSWTETYSNPKLYNWFLENKLD